LYYKENPVSAQPKVPLAPFVFFSPSQFEMLRTGPTADIQQPKLNYQHFAERILMEAARGSSVREQIARMVNPFVDSHELVAEHVYGITLALFDAKELRPTLAMLMRDGCLGYGLYTIRRMIILARRMHVKNDYQQLLSLLRS
jgi:hypothetical protein